MANSLKRHRTADYRKEYKKITINDQVELLSLTGDFALNKGKPVVHAHLWLWTFLMVTPWEDICSKRTCGQH